MTLCDGCSACVGAACSGVYMYGDCSGQGTAATHDIGLRGEACKCGAAASLCGDHMRWGYMLSGLIQGQRAATLHVNQQGGSVSLHGSPACAGATCCGEHQFWKGLQPICPISDVPGTVAAPLVLQGILVKGSWTSAFDAIVKVRHRSVRQHRSLILVACPSTSFR